MQAAKELIKELFKELNQRIEEITRERQDDGLLPILKCKVQLLGQISLLVNEKVAVELSLAQTGDLDALLVSITSSLNPLMPNPHWLAKP